MEQGKEQKGKNASILLVATVAVILTVITVVNYHPNTLSSTGGGVSPAGDQTLSLDEKVIPSDGVVLPVSWGSLGTKLVSEGVIDGAKFKALYVQRGAWTEEYQTLLLGQNDGKLKITREN